MRIEDGQIPETEESLAVQTDRRMQLAFIMHKTLLNKPYCRNRLQVLGSTNKSGNTLGWPPFTSCPEQPSVDMGTEPRKLDNRLPECSGPREPEPRCLHHFVGWS
jgi:hypothetical protein